MRYRIQVVKIATSLVNELIAVTSSAIQTASLAWNEQGTPVSLQFDDVYFSNQNGLEEVHHVFLQGNQLPSRFHHHPRPLFIVAESGFGTGLNFLMLWQAFQTYLLQRAVPSPLQRLHFISFEKYPLSAADLRAVHQQWPLLAPLAAELQQHWPLPLPGCHRLLLAQGRVTLDLWFGDINTLLPQCDNTLNNQVDAWFLDGFSPAKNPDMWTPELFHAMARFARPQATFATFTVAGVVRRGLQQAGFVVEKQPGCGQKRQILAGYLPSEAFTVDATPWLQRPAAQQTDDIGLIGGGIASVCCALALLRRGANVTLYCADERAAEGASGNRQGVCYPVLNGKKEEPLENFYLSAFTFARRLYDDWIAQGVKFAHQWCGVTQLAYDESSRHKIAKALTAQWPTALAYGVSAIELSELCGLPCEQSGIHYPLGGWLSPEELVPALMQLAQQQGLICHYQHSLETLTPGDNTWQLRFNSGKRVNHATVVLAAGHQLATLQQTAPLSLYAVRGQVTHLPTSAVLSQLKHVLCYDGYLTPVNPENQHHNLGATYQRDDTQIDYRPQDQQENLQRLIRGVPTVAWPQQINLEGSQARSSIRCVVRDHMPMVGAVPDYHQTRVVYKKLALDRRRRKIIPPAPVYPNLFMLGALGSRGLCSAPLSGEILAGQIYGEPLPLDSATLAALNPNRIWIRKLLKDQPMPDRG